MNFFSLVAGKVIAENSGGTKPQVKEYMEYDKAGTEFVKFSYYSAGTKTIVASKINDGKSVVAGVYNNNMLTIYCIALDPQTADCATLTGGSTTTFSYKGHAYYIGWRGVFNSSTSPASRESYAWTNKCETFELSDIGATGLSDFETIGTYILDYYYSVETDTRLKDFIEGNLTEIIDDTVTEIGSYVFNNNKKITKLDLPNCRVVRSYGLNGANIPTIIMPKLETIEANGFIGCTVTEVNFPLLTSGSLSSLSTLTKAIVSSIDNADFYNDKKLAYCDLGTKITNIKAQAFRNCSVLVTLIIRNTSVVPTIQSNTFTSSAIASGTGFVYVPDELVDSYKIADVWSTYADQIKGLSELPE